MTQAELKTWLIEQLANILKLSPQDVETTIPFDRYGLESYDVVGIMADLEDMLGIEFDDSTVMYEYNTIESFSRYLAEQL